MGSRLELHKEFEELLGNKNVYFQPPTSRQINYPCIIYQFGRPSVRRADNTAYLYTSRYDVTVISKDPEFDLAKKMVSHFQMCSQDRFYTADNLNHWALTIHY